jgi:hypothetical protein
MSIRYLFIDGGCLRVFLEKMAETYANGSRLDIGYDVLTHGYDKVFYYDALPGKDPKEDQATYDQRVAPERELFDKLSVLDRFHVYEGDVRRSRGRRGPEQKKIDVMIAVDMLTHTFRRNMQEATLLTGDLDFKPLIDALVHDGMFVNLWHPRQTPKELIAAADRGQELVLDQVFGAIQGIKPFILPTSESGSDKGEYAPVLARWRPLAVDVLNREARLMHDAERSRFVVVLPMPNHPYVTYFEHYDLDILRAYMRDRMGVMVPEPQTT